MGKILTLHDPRSARAYYLNGVWLQDTMYALLCKHAGERGDAFAVRDANRRLTWSELLAETDRVAAGLHAAGLRAGDRVSVWLPSCVEVVSVFLACSRMGYVCNPSLHEAYTVDEIVQLVQRIACRALFVQPGYGVDAAHHDAFDDGLAAYIKPILFPRHIKPFRTLLEPRLHYIITGPSAKVR